MNSTTKDHKENVTVWQEKLYTQEEVDALRKNWESNSTSQKTEVEKETIIAGKQQRLEDTTVAGLVKKSNRILASITSIFPFDFFPNTINIEEDRITIIKRNFFFSSQVHSLDIEDISNIFVNIAPFFAQLVIVSQTFAVNEVRIKYLRKKEAVLVRRIIEGLRIFKNNKIDTSTYTKKELIAKLEELSTTKIVT